MENGNAFTTFASDLLDHFVHLSLNAHKPCKN